MTAGGTASVCYRAPRASGPVGGWLAISAPFDVEVVEHDDVIGPGHEQDHAGRRPPRHHAVVLHPAVSGRRARLDVTGGKTMSIRFDSAEGQRQRNARPWADVSLDGASLGQTPISNLQVAWSYHDKMVFRHPQLGERRQSVTVTVKGPNWIAADLTK